MNCPTPTGLGEAVLTMATSALLAAVTRFDVDALLCPAMLSVDVVVMFVVMFSTVPAAVLGLTWTTGEKVALAPAASEAIVQVMVPPEPTAGVPHAHPPGTTSERKFVPAGSGMETEMLAAAAGPPLEATTV